MADFPISQGPRQPSRQVTQMPEVGAGFTRVVVRVAALRFGLLNVMIAPHYFNVLLFCLGPSRSHQVFLRKPPFRPTAALPGRGRTSCQKPTKTTAPIDKGEELQRDNRWQQSQSRMALHDTIPLVRLPDASRSDEIALFRAGTNLSTQNVCAQKCGNNLPIITPENFFSTQNNQLL
jgi:hypothetical protein